MTIIAAISGLVPGVQHHVPLHSVDLGVLAPDREAFFVDGWAQTFILEFEAVFALDATFNVLGDISFCITKWQQLVSWNHLV